MILRLFLLTCLSFGVVAKEIPTAKPEREGMSSERLERVTELAERYIEQGRVPGMMIMINRGGRVVYQHTTGNRGIEDSAPLKEDDLYRIYSMTKPITAVAAMQLYENGAFLLNDPVSKYIPELKDVKVLVDGELVDPARPMTVHHILTHTAGFSYGFDPRDPIDEQYREANLWGAENLDDFAVKLSKLPLKYHPGEQWHYSVAVDVTGLLVERIAGIPFDQYLQEKLFDPLDMHDTFFEIPEDKIDRFLPNHTFDRETGKPKPMGRQTDLLGVMDDDAAMRNYRKVRLYSGGGGLVSTTRDYMRFAEMLRGGGKLGDARILSPKTLKFMTRNHLPATTTAAGTGEAPSRTSFGGLGFGLGFGIIEDPVASNSIASKGSFMWGGAAATIFWVDPVEDITVIGMMQLMSSPWPFREELRTATNQAIIESNE